MKKEELVADVKHFNATPANSSFSSHESSTREFRSERVPFNLSDLYYDMSGEKYLHIFNHYRYENNYIYGANAKELQRDGTFRDVRSLVLTFRPLGFRTVVHHDLKYRDILNEINKLCTQDHSTTSCIAVAIMTHGHNGGVLLSADQPYNFVEITDILHRDYPDLDGKPKLCFVQACRSGHLDDSKNYLNESVAQPKHPDSLVVYSSSPHYYSYRSTDRGSWLMQSICEVLRRHHQFFDLLQMLTLVNQDVANKSTNCTLLKKNSHKKQMPETKHTLTKLLKM